MANADQQHSIATIENEEVIHLPIVRGAITNNARAARPSQFKESFYWGAIVWKDKKYSGGLGRKFLPGNGIRVIVGETKSEVTKLQPGNVKIQYKLQVNLKVGDCIELACKYESYRPRRSTRHHILYKIIDVRETELIVTPITAQNVPPREK